MTIPYGADNWDDNVPKDKPNLVVLYLLISMDGLHFKWVRPPECEAIPLATVEAAATQLRFDVFVASNGGSMNIEPLEEKLRHQIMLAAEQAHEPEGEGESKTD